MKKSIFALCLMAIGLNGITQNNYKQNYFDGYYVNSELHAHLSEALFVNGSFGIQFDLTPDAKLFEPKNYVGLQFGSDLGYKNETFLCAPKISVYAVLSTFYYARISYSYLTDFNLHDKRLTPEIGLTVFAGECFLSYSYDFLLDSVDISDISRHKITFGLSFYIFG